ncbi:MAG: EF-hand domain-containing protein [Planctomycetaceae bacterium]|nr:EF-hand domain-containing protein [Planctomycetaceae bacterium]
MLKLTWALVAVVGICSLGVAADAPKERPAPEAVFKKLDKDSSGSLSYEEFKGKREEEKARKAFDRLDKDANGSLSLEEFKAVMKKKADN